MSTCGVVLALLLLSLNHLDPSNGAICDDGEYRVEDDLGGEENWVCAGKPFLTGVFYLPAGKNASCITTQHPDPPQCMQASLSYTEHPPSHGPYRLVPPQHGEYKYLPPQRWLNTLKMGGVAFLYHPCTSNEQIELLRDLAMTCVNRYVITPYAELSQDYPLAVVTWGCVYMLHWVNPPEVKDWLLARGVDHLAADPEEDIMYTKDLINKAAVRNFASLCQEVENPVSPKVTVPLSSAASSPDDLTNPPITASSPPPAPCQSNASHQDTCISHTTKILRRHQTGLTVLIVLLGVVLLGFILLFVFKVVAAWRRRSPKNQRYKSVSRYFPFSYEKQAVEVVVPALGMPKSGLAERQVLLNESDEDEL